MKSQAGGLKLRAALLLSAALVVLVSWNPTPASGHAQRFHEGGSASFYEDGYMSSLSPATRLVTASLSAVSCSGGMAGPFPCKNIDLAAFLPTNGGGNGSGSDIWGWTDPLTQKEYALQGHGEATTFIDVTNPEVPLLIGTLPAPTAGALWRELKVYNNHAYIIQDLNGAGMQIFDLTRLRSAVPGVVFTPDTLYKGPATGPGAGLATVHTITINEATGFAYLNGSNKCSGGGPYMLDLKPNPKSPVFVGCIDEQSYAHDAQCVIYHGPDTAHVGKEICAIYTGQGGHADTLTMYDVTNKGAPVLLSRTPYPNSDYTHQGWFTEDQSYLLLDDELDETGVENTTTYLWDVRDLDAPTLIAPYHHQTFCTDHNQYVVGNLSYQSNYACGLRIMNISNIAGGTLSEVAYFDTAPSHDFVPGASDGGDLQGDWSNYPYFRSGNVVVSNITLGLFVLKPRLQPTAVAIVSFTARARARSVDVTWKTGTERDTLGYNVWRSSSGKTVKLNRSLIVAKSNSVLGATYRLRDATVRAGATYKYRLQAVNRDGKRDWRASASARAQA